MSFLIYLIGYLIFVGGLAWGASRMGMNPTWIAISVVVLLGLGIFTGVSHTRSKDPAQRID